MTNALTTTQLPAHLAALQADTRLMSINQSASAGISAGGWPRISIKSSRFRLQSPQGEEVVVPNLHLDVIIVDANPHGLSKIFYQGNYDPSVEEKAPDCYSDNGVGPSSRATKPQCGTCAACPHNVWGSKILPSGGQGKACGDSKKLAVLIAENPEGPVFELRVPAASLKNWAAYVESLDKRGIPAASVVTRLTFDTAADFPKLMFAATGWATEAQAAVVLEVIGTEEVDQCTGKNDKQVDVSKALPAPAAKPVTAMPAAPAPLASVPPLPAAPAHVAPAPVIVNTPLPVAAAPVPDALMQGAQASAEKPKRTRRTKQQMAEAQQAAATPSVVLPPEPTVLQPAADLPPPFLQRPTTPAPVPPAPAAVPPHGAVLAPTAVTNAALDDLIAKAMQV